MCTDLHPEFQGWVIRGPISTLELQGGVMRIPIFTLKLQRLVMCIPISTSELQGRVTCIPSYLDLHLGVTCIQFSINLKRGACDVHTDLLPNLRGEARYAEL